MTPIVQVYRDAFSGLPRDLWLLAFVALVNRSGTMVLPFIALYLTTELGFETRAAGQFVGLYGFGAALGAFVGGWLSDHIGPIRAQQASLVLGGLSYLVLSTLHSEWAIALVLFLAGTIVESFRPAVMASFARRAPAAIRAKAFAFLRLAVNLGVAIGPAVGGVLAVYSYSWLFYADAATCWFAAALLIRWTSRPRATGPAELTARRPAGAPWKDGPFLAFLALVLAYATVLFQIFSTLPLYFREGLGFWENVIGLLLALNALLIVAFEMVLIHVVRNRDRLRVVAAGVLFLCAGYALMPYGTSKPYLAFTVAVWTFGEMLALPILNVIVAERASHEHQGRYMGMYTMAYAVAFILSPVLGTYLYDRFGPTTLWHLIGGLGVVLSLGTLRLRRHLGTRARC